jgi:signal transduction histidine kinase
VILAEQNKNQKNADLLDYFESTMTKQADSSLLRLSLEKDFNKKASHTAHEIRNPLSAMELHSKIISKRLDSLNEDSISSIKSSISCIMNSIEVLKSITDGLKDFSKDIEIKTKKTDITKTVSNVVEMIRPTFEDKKVQLNLQEAEGIICEFDENKTHQVIYNLLKNALEASCQGDSVDVYFTDNNTKASVLVKDSGCGVKKEHEDKIFYPNFTTKKFGCGIGLCESKKIAKAQRGNVRLVSTSKKGSIFELTLPK